MDLPDTFLTYVNTYYAVQEGLERARRDAPQPPDDDLLSFSRLADPFLWDGEASADRSIYEGFVESFLERFGGRTSSPEDAYDFAREWLAGLEETRFGAGLLDAFDAVVDKGTFVRSFDAVRDQVILRREISEWYPQDEPEVPAATEDAPRPDGISSVTAADAGDVARLVAPDDPERQAALESYAREQLRSGNLLQWMMVEDGVAIATAGLLTVTLPPTEEHPHRVVGLVVLCGGFNDALGLLLDTMRAQAADWGVDEIQEASLTR